MGRKRQGRFLCRQMQRGGAPSRPWSPILFAQDDPSAVQDAGVRHPVTGGVWEGAGTLLSHLSQALGRVMGRLTSYGMWVPAPLGL